MLFACVDAAAKLVEEVFNKDYMPLRLLRFQRLDGHQRDDKLAVRIKIHVSHDVNVAPESFFRPLCSAEIRSALICGGQADCYTVTRRVRPSASRSAA